MNKFDIVNKLILNDLVYCKPKYPKVEVGSKSERNSFEGYGKVISIENGLISCSIDIGGGYTDSISSWRYPFYEFELISLTEKIVKDISEESCIRDISEIPYTSYRIGNIWFDWIGNGLEYYDIKIQYVNELQQLLRLCRLTDLADNLKLK